MAAATEGPGRMSRYSIFSLARNALGHHRNWPAAWRSPDPKPAYDVVIVGGGGHGLATAYYLATEHGITDVAVLEKGWLGSGNTGRNTTVIRSNYMEDASARFFDKSVQLYERLSQALNFNLMFSQRGLVILAHSDHEMATFRRLAYAMHLNGIDSEVLDVAQVKAFVPILDPAASIRYPVRGALLQRRAGTARHDAVAWGFARGADANGVDIIQNCTVTGLTRVGGRMAAVETSRGTIRAKKVAIAVAGHSSVLAAMAGLRLPIESHPLQALVSEPIKPILDTIAISGRLFVYVSQSDKGELVMGADLDRFNSYAQRGSLPIIENQMAAILQMFPIFSRLKMMRQWGGIVDVCPDASPIISKTPIEGLYLNAGWGTGGFKAIPASGFVYAHTIAQDRPHPLNEAFHLDRFASGALVPEHVGSGFAH